MSFRIRSSSKPSTSRGCNKVRLTNKHDVEEIESWVDFVSKMTVIIKNNLVLQVWEGKKNQKNLFMMHEKEWRKDMQNHCINRHLKSNCLQNFRQFSNGVMSRFDKQNKILAQLISIQKSSHTSFPVVQNINVKQERFEMNYDNDQCEIVEH